MAKYIKSYFKKETSNVRIYTSLLSIHLFIAHLFLKFYRGEGIMANIDKMAPFIISTIR